MNNINKIFVTLALTTVSMATFAESKVTKAQVSAAGELTLTKLHEAETLLQNKAANDVVINVLGEARQSQKEFRYEKTERLRQKFGNKLRAVIESLKEGDSNSANANLAEAITVFTEMKSTYDADHSK